MSYAQHPHHSRSTVRFTALRVTPQALSSALIVASFAALLAALSLGSYPISLAQLIDVFVSPTPGAVHDIVWSLRAPRAFAAYACGALLALAGVLLQVLLRNALADPYVLGVSGGASLGALLAMTLGAGAAVMQARHSPERWARS